MTWEETISFIRKKPEFRDLVVTAYFEEDLVLNVERFLGSPEFLSTLQLIRSNAPGAKRLLDVGSGNGISAIAFALEGYEVTAVEPDPSKTIGAGAIRRLKDHYHLESLEVVEEFAENINFGERKFDVIYVRQAMHHALNLGRFVHNLSGLLVSGGIFLSVRDHVILSEQDKSWFLSTHPLHKFYGGENAYYRYQYREAIEQAGMDIMLELKHFDSVINFFPSKKEDLIARFDKKEEQIEARLVRRVGILGKLSFVRKAYKSLIGLKRANIFDEAKVPGRMYSYLARKK